MKYQKLSVLFILLFVYSFIGFKSEAQQWIKDMPGYERYSKISPQIRGSVKQGRISVDWAEDGKSFEYNLDGKRL